MILNLIKRLTSLINYINFKLLIYNNFLSSDNEGN